MGVQGLATFLDNHRKVYRDVRFGRSRLVIDGCNLNYLLYFESGLDQNHGGEYAAYESLIERFITALRTCEVDPYVVLDGGSDHTDKKLETVTQRAEQRIERAHRAAKDGGKENVLPIMTKWVFRQTLTRLKVPVAQCFGEADREIAALADKWQCPVLSNDSDFYIFNLSAGLLPISYFQWQDVNGNGSKSYIPCKRYYTSSFCIYFEIQCQLLPTFAALAGNDYVKLQKFIWSQFAPVASKPQSRLEGLLCWLKDFEEPEDALKAAVELMGGKSRKNKENMKKMLQSLSVGMEEYKLPRSSLMEFFIHGVIPLFLVELRVMQAWLPGDTLDVLLLHRLSLSTPVDHKDLPSVNLTSRPLRQVMYGLVLGKETSYKVEERDREGLQLKFIRIKPTFTNLNVCHNVVSTLRPAVSWPQAELSERLQVLLEALGVNEERLNALPPQLRLPVAVTCYWWNRARPRPDLKLLKSLLLGMNLRDTPQLSAAVQARCHQKPDVGVAHAFSQWQVCMKDSMHLNQLLGLPLPEPDVARFYQGTLVHQLVHMRRTGSRLKHVLKTDQASVQQYCDMLSAVRRLRPRQASEFSESEQAERRALNDQTNLQPFQLDYDEETETEVCSLARAQEELRLDDRLLLKTRYKTKERRNRCNKVELSRKEERRGTDLL
uniref:XPG N-terminal domain-containing protein n=1 Tax=Oreochromis niloticus TaxID=8128 RepID=A0A669E6L0_ORENI